MGEDFEETLSINWAALEEQAAGYGMRKAIQAEGQQGQRQGL